MSQDRFQLSFHHISLIDIEDLKQKIDESEISIIEPPKDGESHNELSELGTIALITITHASITALAFWLIKNRKEELIEWCVTVRTPAGLEITTNLKISRSESSAPEEQILKQLSEALKLSADDIVSYQKAT